MYVPAMPAMPKARLPEDRGRVGGLKGTVILGGRREKEARGLPNQNGRDVVAVIVPWRSLDNGVVRGRSLPNYGIWGIHLGSRDRGLRVP